MAAIRKIRVRQLALLISVAGLGAGACGDDDFKNEPRAAAPVELSGVIKPGRVIVSPRDVGAGAVRITISNQTDHARTVRLKGQSVDERVGPVYPQDTATLQKTLEPGRYELRAVSDDASAQDVMPAGLTIGRSRPESNDRLLLP